MNHSIYSADRTTHIKIVVVALVAGIAVAGFGISAWIYPDRARHEGRQGRDDHEFRHIHGPLTKDFRNSRGLFSSPPKSPRGYVEDPKYPKSTTENARSPRAFSFCAVGRVVGEAGDTTSACHRTLNRIRFSNPACRQTQLRDLAAQFARGLL